MCPHEYFPRVYDHVCARKEPRIPTCPQCNHSRAELIWRERDYNRGAEASGTANKATAALRILRGGKPPHHKATKAECLRPTDSPYISISMTGSYFPDLCPLCHSCSSGFSVMHNNRDFQVHSWDMTICMDFCTNKSLYRLFFNEQFKCTKWAPTVKLKNVWAANYHFIWWFASVSFFFHHLICFFCFFFIFKWFKSFNRWSL